jgi:hypothetical protein
MSDFSTEEARYHRASLCLYLALYCYRNVTNMRGRRRQGDKPPLSLSSFVASLFLKSTQCEEQQAVKRRHKRGEGA